MDLLQTAMVDITTLALTSRALGRRSLSGESDKRGKLRHRLRAELRRSTHAYVDTLARGAVVDPGLLVSCRAAAERQMPLALPWQDELNRVIAMDRMAPAEPGVPDGAAAARQDLRRLARIAIDLRQGVAVMHDALGDVDREDARKAASRLGRRFRRALIAYAVASHRRKGSADKIIVAAREAALAELGKRSTEEAASLGRLEARGLETQTLIRVAVLKRLNDLVLDWVQSG